MGSMEEGGRKSRGLTRGQEKADESELQPHSNRHLNYENSWALPVTKLAGS